MVMNRLNLHTLRTFRMKRVAVSLICPLTLWLVAAAPADPIDPASLVPADALGFVGVVDVDDLWEKTQKSAAYRMMHDPAGKSLKEFSLMNKFVEHGKKALAKVLDTSPDKLVSPFGGPLVVYLQAEQSDKTDEDVSLVLIAGVDDYDQMRSYFSTAIDKLRDATDDYEKDSFAGQTIHAFVNESGDADAQDADDDSGEDEPNSNPLDMNEQAMDQAFESLFGEWFSGETLPPHVALCLTDDRLYVAEKPEQIKDALRRARGGQRAMADFDDYKLLHARFEQLGDIRFLVNAAKLVELVSRENAEAAKAMAALGLKGFGSLVGHIRYGSPDTYESMGQVLLLIPGKRVGLAKILSMENAPITPPETVGAENAIYFSLNVNVAGVVDEVQRMIRQSDPDAADQMTQALGDVETPDGKLNIRTDVIDNLRPPLRYLIAFAKPYGPENVRLLFSIGHRDKTAMGRLLSMMAKLSPMPMTDREVRGHTLWDMPVGGFSLGVGNHSILAGSTGAVEGALSGDAAAEPLAGTKAFHDVSRFVPEKAWGVMFVDARRMFEAAITLAKQRDQIQANAMGNPSAMVGLAMAEAMTATMDKEQLEKARDLLKYQSVGLFTLSTTPDGILMTQVTLNPPAE